MSADNGIYIAKFPDGYRIAHAQAIENIDYYPEGSPERKKELQTYFGTSPVYGTLEHAWDAAFTLEDEILKDSDGFGFIEYGISFIGQYEKF